MDIIASNRYEKYLYNIEDEIKRLYDLSDKARKRGFDPSQEPESKIVKDFAEIVEGLVGPLKVAERIRELSKKIDKYEMAFIIAEDIIHAKFGHISEESDAEQAIRTALAIMTGGITAAPLQGITHVKIKQNYDKSRYLSIYFAGPIRSAGGTETALILVLGDFIRRKLGLNVYKPIDEEIKRFIEELRLYEREVSRFQYHITDEEVEYSLKNIPVEIAGTETDKVEVSSFRNLTRIETNRVRGGALRVLNDGIIGRSQKVLKIIEKNNFSGWEWLKQLGKKNEGNEKKELAYMEDVIAGRPIFSFPSRVGGFRLRYGRSRNTGLSALGLNPLTMIVLKNFLASGTQLKIEKPCKGGIVLPVDTIDSSIVKLKDGSVVRVDSLETLEKIKDDIICILFLGDILISYGEYIENNKSLDPSGYVEEWWIQDLIDCIKKNYDGSIEKVSTAIGISQNRLNELIESPLEKKPSIQEAIDMTKILKIPLHPKFTYFWENLNFDELFLLRTILLQSEKKKDDNVLKEIKFPSDSNIKIILEKLCLPHIIIKDYILIVQEAPILELCLRLNEPDHQLKKNKSILDVLRDLSGIELRAKGSTYIGARMGRPEKAKRREMTPKVDVLFPLDLAGGSRRNIVEAVKKEIINVKIIRMKCPKCNNISFEMICPNCNIQMINERVCIICKKYSIKEVCPHCNIPTIGYEERKIKIKELYENACKRLNITYLDQVKGVKGLSNKLKIPELIEKGILRAKYDLSVFKDGTIRFDATNAPITHFKPIEIGTDIEKLKVLGYVSDIFKEALFGKDQLCELYCQDVIIPKSSINYLIKISNFIDELLQKVYGLPSYYNIKREEDLIGHLIIGFAPHTSAGIIGRIIGYSETNVCYAHPLWHNIKRRDCDGDEDAIMLVLDVLLNFSKLYLPERIGGMMDAPLLLISRIDPFEVDEAQNMDLSKFYPLTFYEKTQEYADPKIISQDIDLLSQRLGTIYQFENYSYMHETLNINEGNLESSYIKLGAMENKLSQQLELAEKIKAVEPNEVAKKILTTHFLSDIAGNLKAFSRQKFRCKKCNSKYRRIPLSGRCNKCGGNLSLTVYEKSIKKYLTIAENITEKYNLENYYKQRISLIKDEVNFFFKNKIEKEKQVKLVDFM